jgi:catechol 2,3-dioxygenase
VAIKVSKVGHVVLRVSSLDRSLPFYCDALGLSEVARRDFGEGPMAFLSTGNTHHDVALVEVGASATASGGLGLHHFALRVGGSVDDLAAVKAHLDRASVPIHMVLDHHVSQGLYVSDPDGNLIELYVDGDPEIWKAHPEEVANSDPLELSD